MSVARSGASRSSLVRALRDRGQRSMVGPNSNSWNRSDGGRRSNNGQPIPTSAEAQAYWNAEISYEIQRRYVIIVRKTRTLRRLLIGIIHLQLRLLRLVLAGQGWRVDAHP